MHRLVVASTVCAFTAGVLAFADADPTLAPGPDRTPRPLDAGPSEAAPSVTPSARPLTAPTIADAPIEAYRTALLDLAFDAASAIPMDPHIKDRSRAQEAVVEALFELDQPRTALDRADRIENWRRGLGHADFAYYAVTHDDLDVEPHLVLAREIAGDTEDWRRDRINVRVARVYAWMGDVETATSLEADDSAESGTIATVVARRMAPEKFDTLMASLDEMIATNHFDLTRNALHVAAELFDRFFADPERRDRAEERIRTGWAKTPYQVRIELLMTLAESALKHGDAERALALLDDADAIVEETSWTAEFKVPLVARIASVRGRAGDRDGARARLEGALALYDAELRTIANVFRAEALRPVAEAYVSAGDRQAAVAVYRRAVEAGVENPNSRPRALDLSATCISLAMQDIEPDPALAARLAEIRAQLGSPW